MALDDDNNEWHSCLIDPDKDGFYEMRRAPHGIYPADGAEPYMWEDNCWYDLLGEALMFHPLDGSQWQWREISTEPSNKGYMMTVPASFAKQFPIVERLWFGTNKQLEAYVKGYQAEVDETAYGKWVNDNPFFKTY